MALDRNKRQLSEAWLQHQRILLGFASTVYLVWWFVVTRILPASFNPFLSRLAICSSFLIVLGLSYRSSFVRRNIDRFFAICAYALTGHYFYLFNNNPGDINWVVGSYITVVAVGSTLENLSALVAFTGLVIASTSYVALNDSTVVVAAPGMFTILVLLHVVFFLRSKADAERQRRIKVEAERASIEVVSRAKSLFLANMSHELRTPLTSIVGFSELLSDAEELSPDSRVCVERIRVNSQTLMETVNQILNLTEDDFAQLKVDIEPFSIRELVAAQMKEIEATANKDIALSLTVHEPFVDRIISDAGSIGRILRSVLSNAFKFTTSGEIAVMMNTELSETSDALSLTIRVRDTGIGIEASERERVFDTFRQAEDGYTRPFGGVGLGLTIARKIARAMGGDVTITESTPGIGTTVCISLEVQAPLILEIPSQDARLASWP